MKQGIFGEVNLFADQDEENKNYINALDAIGLIGHKTGNHTPDVCRFLMLKGFNYSTQTYRKDYLGRILVNDSRIEDIPFEDWSITSDILKKGLENFKYSGNRYSDNYEKADYEHYYWLKSDFFNFEAIQKLNITPDDYSNFLISEVMLLESKRKKYTFIEEMEKLEASENQADLTTLYLYKAPLLTLHEAACIISDHDPETVDRCRNDTNFSQNFASYLRALSFLDACVGAGEIAYDFNTGGHIYATELKSYLHKEGIIVDGFNDDLQGAELEKNTDASNIELQQLKLENEKLKAELAEKDQKIKELESLNPKNDMDLLSLIFDESATEIYAPDLVNAIKLWKYLYVDNKSANDSHSSRANHWIVKNTPYKGESTIEVKRLREVTSPFNGWHSERKNKLNK